MKPAQVVEIIATINELIQCDEMFTVNDVATELAELGYTVDHHELAAVILALHDKNLPPFMVSYPYHLTDGIYHPYDFDPKDYSRDDAISAPQISWPNVVTSNSPTPIFTKAPTITWPNTTQVPTVSWPNTQTPQATQAPVAPKQSKSAAPKQPKAVAVKQDVIRVKGSKHSRGRVTVPVKLTRAVKFHTGQSIYVCPRNHNQEGLVLLPKPPKSGETFGVLTVDYHGNVRLTAAILAKAFKKKVKNFSMRTTDNLTGVVVTV